VAVGNPTQTRRPGAGVTTSFGMKDSSGIVRSGVDSAAVTS
jgi:hypothetical protein